MDQYIRRFDVQKIESDPHAYPEDWNADYEAGFHAAIIKVLNLPHSDVRFAVRGEWIYGKEIGREYIAGECINIDYEDIKCSVCKTQYKPYVGKFNFCPNCGSYNGGVM